MNRLEWSVLASSRANEGQDFAEFSFNRFVYKSTPKPGQSIRGFHTLVIDLKTGGVVDSSIYDTHASKKNAKEMMNYINHKLGFNKILYIASVDEAVGLFLEAWRKDVCHKLKCKLLP